MSYYLAQKLHERSGELLPITTKDAFTFLVNSNPAIVILSPIEDARNFRGRLHPDMPAGTYTIHGPFGKDPVWTAQLTVSGSGSFTVE